MLEIDQSIRLKVSNTCQLACSFCHNEGTELPIQTNRRLSLFSDPKFLPIAPVQDLPSDNGILREFLGFKRFGVNEIHLTGGEPTSNKDLPNIIRYFSLNGFEVKMTTNGQYKSSLMQELITAGLQGVNFSVLSLNPEEFMKTQSFCSHRKALVVVRRLAVSIVRAKKLGIPIKVNTVIGNREDYSRVDTFLDFCRKLGIPLVLLNDIGLGQVAEDAVFDYIQEKRGVTIQTSEPINSSSGKKTYLLSDGQHINAKYLRPYYPDVVCGDCDYKGTPNCLEKYYGIRVEMRDKPYIRLCIQKNNSRTLFPLSDFLESSVYNQL